MVAKFNAVLIEHAILRFKGVDHPSTKCKLALQTYEWRTKKELRCCDDDDIRLHDFFYKYTKHKIIVDVFEKNNMNIFQRVKILRIILV